MGCYDRSKNKLKACALCLLVGLAVLIELSEGRKVVGSGRVTKPTPNRGYANPDIAKLSYSPSQSAAAPPKAASVPASQGGNPPIGWNVPNNAPPPYSAVGSHGPPPPYSPQSNPNVGSGFNVAPPPYAQGNTGFHAPPPYPTGGIQAPAPAFGAAPNPYHSPQPAPGYQGGFQPGGYPQQPAYQPPVGGFQQPGTDIHHYESQPSSGGSGIGTVLGAGAAGLAAGVGGAALYDALKPKEDHKEATTEATTTTTTTLAPINPNGEAPLAPLPVNPNGETPLATVPAIVPANLNVETSLAPMPAVHENRNGDVPLAPMPAEATNSTEIVPLAAFPVADNSTTPSSTAAVETPNAALNVQPNQAASGPTTAPQLSAVPVGSSSNKVQVQFSYFLLLVPALCKFLMS